MSKPVLKWAGGKTKLLSQYENLFPKEIGNYYEIFLGGGAVFFHLAQRLIDADRIVTLSDINEHLINFYRYLRDYPEDLIEGLNEMQSLYWDEGEPLYYEVRKTQNFKGLTGAINFGFLNKTCFSGLYRENSKGEFNSPCAKYKKPRICDPDLLWSASKDLQACSLLNQSYSLAAIRAESGDFVYMDPPYVPLSDTANFTAYHKGGFGYAEQEALYQEVKRLASKGVNVMISNSDCDYVLKLYREFRVYRVNVARGITSTKQGCDKSQSELVICTY